MELKMNGKHCTGDTWFIRFLRRFFGACGVLVVNHAWKLMIFSCLLTGMCTLMIPLTPMSNDIADFTPTNAPSFTEWRTSQQFFAGGVKANTVYAFVTAKDGGSMFRSDKMGEAIDVLDSISNNFKLQTTTGMQSFEEFCRAFCVINEPLRTFYNGMRMRDTLDNTTELDLAYPDSHVMGVRSHMDPYLFGVKIAAKRKGKIAVIPTYEADDLNTEKPLKNNLREFKLVVLTFKSELDPAVTKEEIEKWELSIVNYFAHEFNSSLIEVTIFAESFITAEVVRAGLTLLPYLVIGFIIMVTFSASSFALSGLALNQMGWDKLWLAFFGCAGPFMACGVGLGGMFVLGARFGTILCVTPFLILAIGVDDAFLMVNGWQQITATRRTEDLRKETVESELLHRTKEMLIETGPSVSITSITNCLAFAISAISGAPEIQLFSIGNAICVLIAFVFQLTVFGALMVILGRREITDEFRARAEMPEIKENDAEKQPDPLDLAARADVVKFENRKKGGLTAIAHKILRAYCKMLDNRLAVAGIMGLLALYLTISIIGTVSIKPSLKPERLFLSDSPFNKLFGARQEYILPSYGVLWIYVFNPGNVWDPNRRALLDAMIHDFETLTHSVGPYSTKLWLRDFEDFAKFEPEENMVNGSEPQITRFMLTTAYKGADLKDWTNRVTLLKQWREITKTYSDLNITIYQEDGKFLDIIDTMVPQSSQSAMLTLIVMFGVTMLFIPAPFVLFTATFTIVSTSLGVFGFMSWIGTELDPILMCATIMVIGFSVDIPAHIAYHYHMTATHATDVVDRLENTIARVGFPIAQASLSTIICVGSLFFTDLHMSNIFAATMMTVVVIGTIHGIFVMPAIFSACAHFSDWCRNCCCSRARVASLDISPAPSVIGEGKTSQISLGLSTAGSTTIMVQ
ncbi:ptr-3 [Pristionchus pacificus]|uniref:Ptr-3 n=1 Tax=Pristionchus pacificus TaxID=54126 RepID=A0A2A6CYZ6_PRIPA|nr:ptr-3 [Pristionchus pacificus]|eukprot:PDM83326.1 ptr-3 [Pristionchus pacificus]